jgi:hypothetical protein
MISGFVCYSDEAKTYHYKKFLSFWVQVCTYSFGITLIAYLIKPDSIGRTNLILSLAPIATKQYWYVSAYAGLFFVIPWINKLLQACTKRETSQLAFILLSVFMIYVTFSGKVGDCFSLGGGYSFVWLLILYSIGAWMQKCNIPAYFKNSTLVIGILGCILFTWISKIFVPQSITGDIFVNYTSFTIVYVAFALVSIFSKLHLNGLGKKFVVCFAPAAFGVYLIHVQQLVWEYVLHGAFAWIAESSWWLLVIQVLLAAFCIFSCCLIIEKCRLLIFRGLKIDKLVDKIADMVDGVARKIYSLWIQKINC